MGEVVEKLKEQRIIYEIKDEGRSIAVKLKQKEKAIITLSKFSLPHKGKVGFDIFGDKVSGILTTQLEKK